MRPKSKSSIDIHTCTRELERRSNENLLELAGELPLAAPDAGVGERPAFPCSTEFLLLLDENDHRADIVCARAPMGNCNDGGLNVGGEKGLKSPTSSIPPPQPPFSALSADSCWRGAERWVHSSSEARWLPVSELEASSIGCDSSRISAKHSLNAVSHACALIGQRPRCTTNDGDVESECGFLD